MKKIEDWDNVKASDGDFERLAPGGYVCRITAVKDFPYNEETEKGAYLKIEYDIAEGDFTDYHKKNAEQFGWWGGTFYRSYKDSAKGMFKAFTNAIEDSNGYTWNWEEQTLVGKIVGLVLGEEEYEKNNGDIGTRLYVKNVKTAQAIRDGNFKVPEPKKLVEEAPVPAMSEITTDDIPF